MNNPIIVNEQSLVERLADLKLLKAKEMASKKPCQAYIDDLTSSIGYLEKGLNHATKA